MGQEVLALVFTAVAGYLLGSINWSIILTSGSTAAATRA